MSNLKQLKSNQPERSPKVQEEVQVHPEPLVEVASFTQVIKSPQLITPQNAAAMHGVLGNRQLTQMVGRASAPSKTAQRKQNDVKDKDEAENEEAEPATEEKVGQAVASEPPPTGDDTGSNGSNGIGGNGTSSPNSNANVFHKLQFGGIVTPLVVQPKLHIQRAPASDNSAASDEKTPEPTSEAPDTAQPADTSKPEQAPQASAENKQQEQPANNQENGNAPDGKAKDGSQNTAEQAPAETGGGQSLTSTGGAGADAGGGAAGVAGNSPLFTPEAEPEANTEGLQTVQQQAQQTATDYTDMPQGNENVQDARGAVTEPSEETSGRAEGDLMTELGSEPGPSPEILQLCDRIRESIKNKRPPNEDSLVNADPEAMAQSAGNELNSSIQGDAQQVQAGYDEMESEPSGQAQQTGGTVSQIPEGANAPQMDAAQAAPEEVTREDVSLDDDVEAQKQKVDTALEGKEETAALVQSGPVAEMREAQGELEQTAEQGPEEVLAQQTTILNNARGSMQELQAQALERLQQARTNTVQHSQNQKGDMVQSEQEMRQQIGQQANRIYDNAQQQVNELMAQVPQTAMAMWDAGVDTLSTRFKASLAQVKKWIDDRHDDGILGDVTEFFDNVFGYPDWIVEAYDNAEKAFGDGVCNLLKEISTEVNRVVRTCQQIIQNARNQINELFANLPEDMQNWANEQKAQFDSRLNGLTAQVMEARNNFNQQLMNKASSAVQEVRQEVHALREKAKGLIGRITDALNQFLEDPAKFIINGLLELAGIAADAFWAVIDKIGSAIDSISEDPVNFANNLMGAMKTGFEKFFENFPRHLMDGLFTWLFSRLSDAGVQAPKDFSLPSIITFFMQVLGFTWERIKRILGKIIGEENVEMIEQAWDMISDLIAKGPEGIFQMIADALNPQNILDTIIQTAIDFLVETLIKQVAMRIIGMLNPAGAIFQALEAIYKVLKWIFENASRIFSLIETVVNGVTDLIAGNIGGMATAIEGALAKLLPTVIDFLADLLGLGGLPQKVADAIKGIQETVEQAITRALQFVAEKAKALLKKLGFGKKDEDEKAGDGEQLSEADKQKVSQGKLEIDREEAKYLNDGDKIAKEDAEKVASAVSGGTAFKSVTVVSGEDSWDYDYVIQRTKDGTIKGEKQRMPKTGGEWTGSPGNSHWIPDDPSIKKFADDKGFPGIPFVDNVPQFRPWAVQVVVIEVVTGDNEEDFKSADLLFAQKRGGEFLKSNGEPNREAVKRFRKGQYTWHHHHLHSHGFMMLLPMKLHAKIPHIGGASRARNG